MSPPDKESPVPLRFHSGTNTRTMGETNYAKVESLRIESESSDTSEESGSDSPDVTKGELHSMDL